MAELKAQLIDAAEHKIAALERGRKVDDLQARVIELESEKNRLLAQLSNYKSRCRATIDTSLERGRRDEHAIHVSCLLVCCQTRPVIQNNINNYNQTYIICFLIGRHCATIFLA